MAPHAMGSATISFGLVAIPVKLYSATQPSKDVSFNFLHDKCGSRMKQQYVCPVDGEVVSRDHMVKGYEFSKDKYVIFTADELKALEEKATQTIEITEFVPATSIDPIYFDKAYYLGPDKGGDKPYGLLARTMAEAGRVALAKYAARGKMYLIMLRPMGDTLVMQQLRYADEVRTAEDIPVSTVKPKDNELKLALQLVSQITADEFKPEAYEDEVKKRQLEAINRKIEGQDITESAEDTPQAGIIDLMEALKASLEKGAERKPPKRVAAKTDKAPAKKKKNA